MYCSKCGAQNRDGGKFCIKYGAPLKKAGEERTAVPTETGSKGAVPAAYGGESVLRNRKRREKRRRKKERKQRYSLLLSLLLRFPQERLRI